MISGLQSCVMCHNVGYFPPRSLNYGDEYIVDEKEENNPKHQGKKLHD